MSYLAAIVLFILLVGTPLSNAAADSLKPIETVKNEIIEQFGNRHAVQWGERLNGVRTRLATDKKVIALTLDACGSQNGKGYDAELISFLEREQIPATLFVNARWIDANPEIFRDLAKKPLFEIANHGLHHKPASINGRTVYGIRGTQSVVELVDEIELNARKIEGITGKRPQLYRSGTAYYDEVAVAVAQELGHQVAGYSVLGDAGATYSQKQVAQAVRASKAGDVILCHFNHPKSATAAGLKAALPELKKQGYQFVRMSDYPLR